MTRSVYSDDHARTIYPSMLYMLENSQIYSHPCHHRSKSLLQSEVVTCRTCSGHTDGTVENRFCIRKRLLTLADVL